MNKKITTIDQLNQYRHQLNYQEKIQINISLATCGIISGGNQIYNALNQIISNNPQWSVEIKKVGCLSLCAFEPIIEVIRTDGHKETFGNVTEDNLQSIINYCFLAGPKPQHLDITYLIRGDHNVN